MKISSLLSEVLPLYGEHTAAAPCSVGSRRLKLIFQEIDMEGKVGIIMFKKKKCTHPSFSAKKKKKN